MRITTAADEPHDDIAARQRRYLISMAHPHGLLRRRDRRRPAAWLRWVLVAGAVFLPYVAVVMANAVTPQGRRLRTARDAARHVASSDAERDSAGLDRSSGMLDFGDASCKNRTARAEFPRLGRSGAGQLPPWLSGTVHFRTRPTAGVPVTELRTSSRRLLRQGLPASPPSWELLWNNPKLHTPDRRKTWLACDEHRQSLSRLPRRAEFLTGRRRTTRGRACDRRA